MNSTSINELTRTMTDLFLVPNFYLKKHFDQCKDWSDDKWDAFKYYVENCNSDWLHNEVEECLDCFLDCCEADLEKCFPEDAQENITTEQNHTETQDNFTRIFLVPQVYRKSHFDRCQDWSDAKWDFFKQYVSDCVCAEDFVRRGIAEMMETYEDSEEEN